MKKIILILIVSMFSLLMYSQTYDVTISGVVTDEITGEPMIQHELTIYADSSSGGAFTYYNVVFTDGSGFYFDSFPVPSGEEGMIEVSTQSCGAIIVQSDYFTENDNEFTFNFQVCSDPGQGDCEAMYYYYPDSDPLNIQFNDISMGDPTFWLWDFGDGDSSTEQNPLHTFPSTGDYLTSLTITSQDSSCYSVVEMLIRVGNDTIWPGDCEAFYYYYQGDELNTINFIDESFGSPTSWEWGFGDGFTSTEQNPVHEYATPGEYIVSLSIIADSGNCTSYFEDLVFVYNDSTWPGDCQAMFYSYPDSNDLFTINFTDMSIVGGNPTGIPDTWYWDFGDGNSSTEQNPTHTYTDEGDFDVCLTITAFQGNQGTCESTECQIVIVGELQPGCTTWYEYQTNDLSVDFQAFLEGGYNVDYNWNFGDGSTGTGTTITHTFTESGMYEVALTAINNDSTGNCTSTYIDIIWVGEDISFDISGFVYLQVEGNDSTGTIMADFANVYLSTFDTIGNGLINVATTQIDEDGYYEFEEASLQNCVYFIQAELIDQSAYVDDYVPTYHFSSLNWEDAIPVFPFWYGFGADIHMIGVSSSSSGSGIITGTVTQEGSRDLLSNIEVLLLDIDGNPIKHAITNNNGIFSFSELSIGTYIVYTEIVGIETIPFNVTLDEQNNSSIVSVVVKNGQALLGIESLPSAYIESIENIFPNPVAANASLNITIKESSNIKVEVLNQYGQTLYVTRVSLSTGKHEVIIPSTSFAYGMYFVKITANDNISSVRKFIKLR